MRSVYTFIDSQNLNLGIRSQDWKLDFARFRVYLSDKFKVKKAFLFIGFIKENHKLYNYLQKSGFHLIFKPITKDDTGHAKGNVDAELVLHAMIQYKYYSQAIIVSGDGDFFCLAEYLNSKKKLKNIIIPNQKKYSKFYLKIKSKCFFLNNQRPKLKIRP